MTLHEWRPPIGRDRRRGVEAIAAQLSAELPRLMHEHTIPGLAVGVCDRAGLLWSRTFGTTRAGGGAVTPRTMFSVQSCSKMYTATAVMLGVQDGLVELDESITTYLPEFRVNSRFEANPEQKITLRHLLSHTAGFTHEAPVGNNFQVGRQSFEEHCDSISQTWLRFPVGHHYEYSNLGIDLAAHILARRSGRPFAEYTRRKLFAPLGLTCTTFNQRRIAREPDRAMGHDMGSKVTPVKIPMVGAGGLYTSIQDACRFVQFHLAGGEGLIDSRWLEEMCRIPFAAEGQESGYALGISVTRNATGFRLGHSGGGFGFLSDMYWMPDCDVGVVLLTNSADHPLQEAIVGDVLKEWAGTSSPRPSSPPAPTAVDPPDINSLCGQYCSERAGVAVISDDGSRQLVRNGQTHRVSVVSSREIALVDGEHDRYRFLLDESGDVRYLQHVRTGTIWYRNEPSAAGLPGGSAGAPAKKNYAVKAGRRTLRTVAICLEDGGSYIEWEGAPRLRLEAQEPGLYFSSTGEALDLRRSPPTYRNIRLFEAG